MPEWVVPVAVIGGVTLVGVVGILWWARRSARPVTENRRKRASKRRRLAANTHRSIRLESESGDTWVVCSNNTDVQRVLTSMLGAGAKSADGSMRWRMNRASRNLVWEGLRSHLKSERASRGGLVHWADQRVYDFLSAEHE